MCIRYHAMYICQKRTIYVIDLLKIDMSVAHTQSQRHVYSI